MSLYFNGFKAEHFHIDLGSVVGCHSVCFIFVLLEGGTEGVLVFGARNIAQGFEINGRVLFAEGCAFPPRSFSGALLGQKGGLTFVLMLVIQIPEVLLNAFFLFGEVFFEREEDTDPFMFDDIVVAREFP